MSHKMPEPRIYKNKELMDDLNEMMIRIKIHMLGNAESILRIPSEKHSKPTNKELDALTDRLMDVLRQDYKTLKH